MTHRKDRKGGKEREAGRAEGVWGLGLSGEDWRPVEIQFTQASIQGQVGQGCYHFANKETEARKMKSLTQNHLAGERPGQAVSPHCLLPEPTTTEPDSHQQGGAAVPREDQRG